ncbi:hypothetical protein [Clostridium brassicae]|uniref:CopG family transcriptional regulator n=1 Tax=Clostridium brassicae TaxID=2999072 RepID=A0ABT4D6T7_9CLOT|nr:hypothetical protein [Clostridium brassicae]MCY6957893.1 hypothetical protein [Clostridium brassicae]
MKRKQWTTTFREDLRKGVNVLAAELGVKPNHVLEIAFEYLKDCLDAEGYENTQNYLEKEILYKYKKGE